MSPCASSNSSHFVPNPEAHQFLFTWILPGPVSYLSVGLPSLLSDVWELGVDLVSSLSAKKEKKVG